MKTYERFLKYVKIPTMSDEEANTCPSTEKQLVLARLLCEELASLGLSDARVDENGYVYASLPANCEGAPSIGFIAHMDTAPDAPDDVIKPVIVEYTGEDILLNGDKGLYLRESDYPALRLHRGQHLVVTDGTTLLGADDKAGIAEIMTMLELVVNSDIKHGKLCIGFTPDEEIGRGADLFDVEGFGADFAYTVDGGYIGEIEYENFNAAAARVSVSGISIHPGTAKGKMKNAARIACEFNALLPECEIPEMTEGYEGFHHMTSMAGECESATVTYIIRDHDMKKFQDKKLEFERAAALINEKYGVGTLTLELKDSYYNMREKILPCMHIIKRAEDAMARLGIKPITVPIRGGTDGARLSYMGLPCPNLGTGGGNAHSRFEYACCEDMEKISNLLLEIART